MTIEISIIPTYRSEVTLQEVRLGLTFNKDLKEGESLPITLNMGLGCKIVPTLSAEPLTQARDCVSVSPLSPSPLLFESPTPVETEENISGRKQNLQKDPISLREDIEERKLQLTREQEEWKEWKKKVEEDIMEDLSIIEDNKQRLAEWEEQLRHLEEEDEKHENQWRKWQQELRENLTKVQKERNDLLDLVQTGKEEIKELHLQCQQKEDHSAHLQQRIDTSSCEMDRLQKVIQEKSSQFEQLQMQHQESSNNLQQLQEKVERNRLKVQQLEQQQKALQTENSRLVEKLHKEQIKVKELEMELTRYDLDQTKKLLTEGCQQDGGTTVPLTDNSNFDNFADQDIGGSTYPGHNEM